MKISESKLKSHVIAALVKRNIRVIDLRAGTFDLFIDEGKRLFVELKIANMNYKPFAKNIGINLKPQTNALRTLKKLPIIFACHFQDMEKCFLITPKELKSRMNERKNYSELAIGLKSIKSIGFNNAIRLLIKEIKL
jgi:hypothetical protein